MKNSPVTVYIPKSAVESSKSRNGLSSLLISAGYDEVQNGLDRQDAFEQGGIRFQGVKEALTLADQLESRTAEGAGIIMGSDVLVEAALLAARNGTEANIERILELGIGKCGFQVMAPTEKPVNEWGDLSGRTVYTKFPATAERVLRVQGLKLPIKQVTGPEIRVNEMRNQKPVAAFEIVESGGSAKANDLQIADGLSYPSLQALRMNYTAFPKVSTDLFALNLGNMSQRTRDILEELGLALESALDRNEYVTFKFNTPTANIDRYRNLGMRGPTVSSVLSRDGQDWSAVEICVRNTDRNPTFRFLARSGASEILTTTGVRTEPNPATSPVLTAMSLKDSASKELPESRVPQAEFLLQLDQFLADRLEAGDPTSSTVKAVQAGIAPCAAKCGEEVGELIEALNNAASKEAKEEAADALYRFLVALRSTTMQLTDLLQKDAEQSDAEGLSSLLQSSKKGWPSAENLLAFQATWNKCSTLLRKSQSREDVITGAQTFFTSFIETLAAYDIDIADIVTILQGRHRPVNA